MLDKMYTREFLGEVFCDQQEWDFLPVASDRRAWSRLFCDPEGERRKTYLIGKAEKNLVASWPELPATLYMQFARTGNRSNYETPYFKRRLMLEELVLAECAEYKKRFLDEIINGLWLIIGEPSWCIPAHALRRDADLLPREDRESVDLFACETAARLAMALFLLEQELNTVSPSLCARIRNEIDRRIIRSLAEYDDFWWFSGSNNWAPWCASNVALAAMLTMVDRERMLDTVWQMMMVTDRFIENYPDDGGCDEGPGYWAVAPGAMFILLELLYSGSRGKISVYHEAKIKKMGEFIESVHLHGPWFVNFADAGARGGVRRDVVYRYGERIGSERMKNLARLGARDWQMDGDIKVPVNSNGTVFSFTDIFWFNFTEKPQPHYKEKTVWFPDLQVLVARESVDSGTGLILACKGGNNQENHNHNDVGHFIIFADGQPVIVDIGVSTYTRQTFSPQRYEIWCIRGSAHNAPVINGQEQCAGREYHAENVVFRDSGEVRELTMDLEQCYPAETGLLKLQRLVRFDSGDSDTCISVQDSFRLREAAVASWQINLFSPCNPETSSSGRLKIKLETGRILFLDYDNSFFEFSSEPCHLSDSRLQASWGDCLYKLSFNSKSCPVTGNYEFKISSN